VEVKGKKVVCAQQGDFLAQISALALHVKMSKKQRKAVIMKVTLMFSTAKP